MAVFRFEDFELNVGTYQLLRDGEPVHVEPQVFDVLAYLIDHRDRLVSKVELQDEVWGDRFVSESAVTSRIKSARRALGDDGRAQRLIRNAHGRGYQFVGDVTVEAERSGALDVPGLGSSRGAPTSLDIGSATLSLSVDEEFPFVGRGDVAEQTAPKLAEVSDGATRAILIGGEPGIGKTRLAAELASRAVENDGFRALAGRCDPHLASSLQPWLEALGSYVQSATDEELSDDTAGVRHHLRHAFPTLDGRLGATVGAAKTAGDEYATLDAIVVFLERISARHPLAVVLDDVHWAGGATRALTSLLLRRGWARVLVLLTFRTTIDDLDGAARDWLNELGGHPGSHRVDLEGLEPDDVDELVSSALGPEDGSGSPGVALGRQVFDMSEGHTLFATELLRDMRGGVGVDHLPRTVADLVNSRLGRLPESVSQLVSFGAAFGQDFGLSVTARSAGLDPAAAVDAVDIALRAELVHEVSGAPDMFRFSHQLVPAAVLDGMSSARRVRIHARIAEVLAETGEASDVELAHHLIEASPVLDVDEVIAEVRATALAIQADHQYDAAASLLDRCVELRMDPRKKAEVLTELGRAYNAAGRQPQALDPLEQSARMARRNGWSDLLVEAALGRWGQSPFRASRDRTVIPILDEAIALGDLVDRSSMARLLAKRAAFNLFTGDLAERDDLSGRAVGLAPVSPSLERLEVLEARWMAIACPTTAFDLVDLEAELQLLRKELGALTTDACAPEIGLYWRGRGEELWELAAELESDPRQRREVDQWRTTALAGSRALFSGDWDTARELTDKALVLGREPWGEAGQVVHGLVHWLIDLMTGSPAGSLERWDRIVQMVPSDAMRLTRAWVHAVNDRGDDAARAVDEASSRVEQLAENFMGGFGLVGFGETVLLLERDGLYEPLGAVLRKLANRMLGHPWAPSMAAADILSRLEHRLGNGPAADENRARAQELYRSMGARVFEERLERLAP